jgi:hypothetical protein
VLRELGLDPEHTTGRRRPSSRAATDPDEFVPIARRRLCLTPDRDAELAAWLAEHPIRWVDEVTTIRWPGAAEP